MRWICKDDIEECLTQKWRDDAAKKLKSLVNAKTEVQRKAILERKASSDIWRGFYKLLPENLKKKCWYCESEDIRTDTPVDHFRPKNKVEEAPEHDGYWWLAFDWENYRCACDFCNSRRVFDDSEGGKACKFPISNPEARAFTPGQEWKREKPEFLDPFDPGDWKLLWFDGDGKPEPKPEATVEEQRKVTNSIDIFHLHQAKIVRARNRIRLDVEKEVKKLRVAEEEGNQADLQDAKNKLRAMVRDTATLSKAAIVYLRQHRELTAVKEILQLD